MDNVLMGKKLGKLFFSFGIHPKVIVSPIFEDFVKSIVEYGPSTYQLASTFTDEKGFASEVDEEADEYIENFINDPVQAGCTLMVNNWQRYDDSGRVDRVDIFAYSKKGAACFKSFKYEQTLGGIQEVISSTIDQLLRLNLHVVQLLPSQENDEMIDGTNYMLENMIDSNEKEAFEKELDQYREELPKLFTAQAMITMLKTCHPRTWWDFCGKHTPVLRKYAIRILSQPCSTLFCRRYEVLLGDLSEDWTTKVNTMIINGNSKLLELEPIILDKLIEDHDAFKDVMELDEEYYYFHFLSKLTDDALVDCVINDPSPSFWDNVNNIKHLLLDCFV
ncbi:uncharacterized protein LOC122300254 isoform X2 [Carya illinoinensis]|nr:uncharacterized protein LOC122300254 isoform X2 [Carya illinoinensis]